MLTISAFIKFQKQCLLIKQKYNKTQCFKFGIWKVKWKMIEIKTQLKKNEWKGKSVTKNRKINQIWKCN